MASPVKELQVNLMKRLAPRRGPTSSAAWNDSVDEIITDLSRLTDQWNNAFIPLVSNLPNGSSDLESAWTDGLDGRVLQVDLSATSSNLVYWNSGSDRPNSLLEQFESVYTSIQNLRDELSASISELNDIAQTIQVFTGYVAKEYDPISLAYAASTTTTLAVYDAGTSAFFSPQQVILPATTSTDLVVHVVLQAHDTTSITLSNTSDASPEEKDLDDILSAMGTDLDGKGIRKIILRVENTSGGEVITDIDAFTIHALCLPLGVGSAP